MSELGDRRVKETRNRRLRGRLSRGRVDSEPANGQPLQDKMSTFEAQIAKLNQRVAELEMERTELASTNQMLQKAAAALCDDASAAAQAAPSQVQRLAHFHCLQASVDQLQPAALDHRPPQCGCSVGKSQKRLLQHCTERPRRHR